MSIYTKIGYWREKWNFPDFGMNPRDARACSPINSQIDHACQSNISKKVFRGAEASAFSVQTPFSRVPFK
jgi:hypothetical protein